MNLLDGAIVLAGRGYYVLPFLLREDGRKVPLVKWGKEASNDADKIRAMTLNDGTSAWDAATHIAVACEPSGIVVVDLDTYYDEDEGRLIEGEELITEWQNLVNEHTDGHTDQPEYDPPYIPTAGNGIHLFFRANPSHPVYSTVKKIHPCIDTRGVGGQYGGLAAVYADMPEIAELPEAPAWLAELTLQAQASELRTPEAPPRPPKFSDVEAGDDRGLRKLEQQLDRLRTAWEANEGNFNDTLVSASTIIGQFASAGHLQREHAYQSLHDLLNELGAGSDQYKTIDSGFDFGWRRPLTELSLTEEQVDEAAKAWISGDALDQLPPPEWLLPGWLEMNSVAQIFGEPGVGKSFIALDIAARVSRGLGWPTADNTPARPLRVAYVIAEGVLGLAERKRAWETKHGRVGDMLFHPRAIQINGTHKDPLQWEAATEFLSTWGPALIIVDTQARCTLGVEENSPKEMNQVYDKIEQMQRKTGACVLLVHHTSKGGQTARGTNAVKGAVATEIHLRSSYGRIRVKCTKQKDTREPNDVYFELEDIGDSAVPRLTVEVPAELSESVKRNDSKMLVRQYLSEHPDVPQTTKEICEAIEVSRPTVSTRLNELLEANEVTKTTIRRDGANHAGWLWNPPVSVGAPS